MKKTLLLYLLFFLWQTSVLAQNKKFKLDPSLTAKDYAPHTIVVKFKPLPASINARQFAPFSPADHALLKKLGASNIQSIFSHRNSAKQQKNVRLEKSGRKMPDLSQIYTVKISSAYSLETAINMLLADDAIEYAEPLYNHQPFTYTPSDPAAQAGSNQYYLTNIKAREAWALEKGNPAITIGIIDYGFYLAHPDLTNNIQYNTADPVDGLDNDNDGYIDNYAGWDIAENDNNLNEGAPHGSFVAGIAAASTDNGIGMAGVGFRCKFLPVKIYSGPQQVFAGYEGIVYAVDRGCQVINLSWGRRGTPSAMEQDVINYAASLDVVIVAAAGNNGTLDFIYPASYDNVISVTGTDWKDEKWSGSNYNEKVDISAPGLSIYSAINNITPYGSYGGTSFAAPQVAGAAALVRSKYPALTAQEVAELLIATTDNINAIPANAAFAGKIGSGRLNVEKALKKEVSKRLQLINTIVSNHQEQPYAQNGDTVTLVISLKSIYGNFDNLQASITSLSPYVQMLQAGSSFGAVSQNNSVNNQNLPFKLVVDKNTPTNISFATLEITYTDGDFTAADRFALPINRNCITIQNSNISLSVSSQARLGYNDDIIGWYGAGRGTGFQYKNTDLLTEAGLMLGANSLVSDNTLSTQVNSIFYDNETVYGPLFRKNGHFFPNQHLRSVNVASKDIAVEGLCSDTAKSRNPTPIGVTVKQQFYTWQDSKFIIIEYALTNISTQTIDQFYAGIFSIWNNLGTASNQADWDAAQKMGYVFNTAANSLYTGVQLLTEQAAHYYVMDNDQTSIPVFDGFTAAEKLTSLSSGLTRTQSISNPQFVAHTLGAQLQDFKNGETRTIAFALLAGDNLNDLQMSAAIAKQKFTELKTGPVPVLAGLDICKDDNVTLAPASGSTFKFYSDALRSTMVAQGKTLDIGKISRDTTFYITNTDSLYESTPATVHVRVAGIKTDFSAADDTLGLYEKETLQLSDKSTNASKWFWQFGDGNTSDLQHPAHNYLLPGEYTVKLISQNSLGCTDSLSQKIVVVNGKKSLTPVVADIYICKGEIVKLAPENGNNFRLYTSLPLTTPIASGTTFTTGAIVKDTTFYITNTDFLFESEPATVHVRVISHTTDFEIASDTLNLFYNEVLAATDKSTDAIQWLWDFGDGSVSTEQNPTHSYSDAGAYTVKLITTNSASCKDSLSQSIQVISTTGLSEEIHSYFKLYPNPTDDWLYLHIDKSWPMADAVTVQVYNHLGQEVYQATVQQHTMQINFFPLPKGMYTVKITAGNKMLTKSILRM